MARPYIFYILFIVFGALLSTGAQAEDTKGPGFIDTQADKLLKEMGDYLKTAKEFTYQAHTRYDRLSPSGQKIQYSEIIESSVKRNPDRMYEEVDGDIIHRHYWYNGTTLTVLDTLLNVFATAKVPQQLDNALKEIAQKYDIVTPLSDLLLSDPYAVLTANVKSSSYIGLHKVSGIECHHLALRQENIDWQIWIEDSSMTVPRKIVITYKNEQGSPQYTGVFKEWNFAPHLPESVFVFEPPKGAEEITLEPIEK